MIWAPRDVAGVLITLALAVAFDAVVIGAVIHGDLPTSTADAVAAGFVLMVALVAAYLGLHLMRNGIHSKEET